MEEFLAFRDQYQDADSAAAAMKVFDDLREAQNQPAQTLMGEARGLFNQNKRPEGYAKVQEVAAKYPASTSYRLAKTWLAEPR